MKTIAGGTHRRRLLFGVGLLGGTALAAVALPRIVGTSWAAISAVVAAVPPSALVALVGLWLAGLVAHTVTLTAALPGLSHRRALLLSLSGSAVANVLPLGGAAGVALNYRMTRRWGFSPVSFASYTVVTNLGDVLVKLALPLILVPLLMVGLPLAPVVRHSLVIAAIALPLLAGATTLVLRSPRLVARLGRPATRAREAVVDVVRTGWPRLSAGLVAYSALLFLLLVACLTLTGAHVTTPMIAVAFCVERIATLVGITPGGLGLVEVGLAGALALAPGANPAGVAAGVLLYRALTFGLEIPVGGVLLAGWSWRNRKQVVA
ncbi:lysylphosphatidylglycerol synthase transmembrane domain-containing protein [Nocardioides sp. GXZ039]|uniref:lysylphosphatidylglycerol synthase transmembrane domain-containing protein n=1 Tax=Nocardioides sp. GXZ039 TaxID=3136018 RepID=UPI0030F49D75